MTFMRRTATPEQECPAWQTHMGSSMANKAAAAC